MACHDLSKHSTSVNPSLPVRLRRFLEPCLAYIRQGDRDATTATEPRVWEYVARHLPPIDELCTVCQHVDFASSRYEECGCPSGKHHFHIGSPQHVSQKSFCPGCRLIASVVNSSIVDSNIAGDVTTILLNMQPLHGIEIEPDLPVNYGPNGELSYDAGSVINVSLKMGNRTELLGIIVRKEGNEPQKEPSFLRGVAVSRSRGRQVTQNASIRQISQWVHNCNQWHGHRPDTPDQKNILQAIRLVDVRDHRIVTASLREEYAALSYVWGSAAPLLTRETLRQYSMADGLNYAEIPQTISDTMRLVKDLGKRYLWVDSLCIIQDDLDDKQQQLPIMDSIYRLADFVIIDASSEDASQGLPGLYNTRRTVSQHTETIDGVQFITIQPGIQKVLERTVWKTRGWTFQELTLASRVLLFTKSQIYWGCSTDTWREDLDNESSQMKLRIDKTHSPWAINPSQETCRTAYYSGLVQQFSGRHFKHSGDVLWAFLGILKLHAARFPTGYIWGLPYERLDATLLWYQQCPRRHLRHAEHEIRIDDKEYHLPYPSWSWLSSENMVSFLDPCGASIVSEVSWHEPFKVGQSMPAMYSDSILSKANADESRVEKAINLLSTTSSILDYGLLHFTALTAELYLSYDDQSNTDNRGRLERVVARIRSATGESIGQVRVPVKLFNGLFECCCESVLMSSNAEDEEDEVCKRQSGLDCGSVAHTAGCDHVRSCNVMLIEKQEEISYRVGLAVIEKVDWEKIETRKKRIILG